MLEGIYMASAIIVSFALGLLVMNLVNNKARKLDQYASNNMVSYIEWLTQRGATRITPRPTFTAEEMAGPVQPHYPMSEEEAHLRALDEAHRMTDEREAAIAERNR